VSRYLATLCSDYMQSEFNGCYWLLHACDSCLHGFISLILAEFFVTLFNSWFQKYVNMFITVILSFVLELFPIFHLLRMSNWMLDQLLLSNFLVTLFAFYRWSRGPN
jgi:hypothetical protein